MNRMYDMFLICLSYALIIATASAATLNTGTRASSADDSVHTDKLPWYPDQRDWKPSHVTDLTIIGMDRIRGSLVGYNTRTGKVMSQKPTEERPMRIAYSEGVLLSAQECFALTKHGGDFQWRPPYGHRTQLWIARSDSGWVDQISKYVLMNRNDGAYCECKVRPVNGLMQNTAMRRLVDTDACVPWTEHPHAKPGHMVRIPGHHERSEEEHTLECEILTEALADTDWYFAHYDQINHTNCALTTKIALSHLADRPRAKALTDIPKPPRARIMTDLKHAARVIDSVDAPLAMLSNSLEQVAIGFRGTLIHRLLELHNNSRLLPHERLALNLAYGENEGMPVSFAYNQSCDSAMDKLVMEALTADNVALTPETSNVTKLVWAFSKHTEEHLTCLQQQMRTMGRAVECASVSLEAQPDSMGPVQASESDVDTALQEIRAAMRPEKLRQMLKEGNDVDDHADELIRLIVTASETMFRRTVSIFSVYQSLVVAWQRYDGFELESGILEDIWCCFASTLVKDPRYPPCLMRSIRLVHREMQKENVHFTNDK